MFKRKQDYYFLFSLLFIIIFSIYLAFDQVQKNNLNSYLALLHDTLVEMIVDEQERVKFEDFYNEFIKDVKNDSLSSGEIKQFAENIIDLKLEKEKINSEDIQKILPRKSIKDQPLNFKSARISKKPRSNWQKLAKDFKKANTECDSIRKENLSRIVAARLIKNQIEIQENLTLTFIQRSSQAKKYYEEKKAELKKLRMDEKEQLARLEKELLLEIEKIESDNVKINKELNSINKLEQSIAGERKKLKSDLSYFDSTSVE